MRQGASATGARRLLESLCVSLLLATASVAAAPGSPSLSSDAADYVGYAVDDLPAWFTTPQLAALDNTPVDNPITNEGAELGRVLFYDPRLSHNNGTSCASCHTQATAFGDPEQFSEGFEGGRTGRHSMSLANARWYRNADGEGRFFWDERAATLEDQVLMPIQDAVEMGSDLDDLVEELGQTDFYPTLFERAFGDSAVTSERVSQALSQFVRSMASYQSTLDRAIAAGSPAAPNFNAAGVDNPVQARAGHALFTANCAGCHRTDAQVANNTHNIGLPRVDADGDGAIDDLDPGAGGGEFKVPSLRNVAERGRFMHDGRFATLEEVIDHYSDDVRGVPNLGLGLPAGGFGFTDAEKAALVAFLETLTDEEFLQSELFSNPLVTLAGDYNGDGLVDDADYDAWALSFGSSLTDAESFLAADGNNDGVVDVADYAIWRDNLGARWDDGFFSTTIAVPEPTGLMIIAAVTSSLLWPPRAGSRAGPVRRRNQP